MAVSPGAAATARSPGASLPQARQRMRGSSARVLWTWIRNEDLPAEMVSPSPRRMPPSTRWPLTRVPLVLPMSFNEQMGGLNSIMKWSRDRNGSSTTGKWTCEDRPTTKLSWRSKTYSCPAWGPAVTRRTMFIRGSGAR